MDCYRVSAGAQEMLGCWVSILCSSRPFLLLAGQRVPTADIMPVDQHAKQEGRSRGRKVLLSWDLAFSFVIKTLSRGSQKTFPFLLSALTVPWAPPMHRKLGKALSDGAEWEDPDWLTSILTHPPRRSEELHPM